MKYEIRNTAKRPISILCNTGETRHLPPNCISVFIEAEIANNPSVNKLESRGLIRCGKVDEKVTNGERSRKKSAAKAETKNKQLSKSSDKTN